MLVNLKTALAARRMRQVDLALALKIPSSTLSEIICGRRPAESWLRTRIAEALRADESWLFAVFTRIPSRTAEAEDSAPVPAVMAAAPEIS